VFTSTAAAGRNTSAMRVVKASLFYFVIVFCAGFVLGAVRMLWLVPRVGARTAELLESPIMLVVVILAAHLIVRRYALSSASQRLSVGFWALALMLTAEFGLVLHLRGLSIREYLATRDPVSGTIYYALLLVFALLPRLVAGD
jgi:nicotinamide riboside transporter PnuC